MRQKNYAVAVAVFSEASRLNPENAVNVLMKATALVHQAYAMNPSASEEQTRDRQHILNRAEIAIGEASNLSDKKVKPDHFTLAMFYEMKGERARSATELEAYLVENPKAQNAQELRNLVNSLRSPLPASATPLNPRKRKLVTAVRLVPPGKFSLPKTARPLSGQCCATEPLSA